MSAKATYFFYAELNDFLLKKDRKKGINHLFTNTPNVKDSIEALGIPHPEVAVVKANNKIVGFDYKVNEGDKIEVFPHYYCPDIQAIVKLVPDGSPTFILDVHLGGLARYLRMAGFDTLYNNEDWGDKFIADTGGAENRVVLSRDIGLLKRSSVIYGYYVRKRNSLEQFEEIVKRYQLQPYFSPFSICIKCNGKIRAIDKTEVAAKLEDGTKREHDKFWQCTDCKQVYWEGTHVKKMEALIKNIKNLANGKK